MAAGADGSRGSAGAGGSPGALDPVFAALSDPTRRSVIELLTEGRTATATQLSAQFPVTRQAMAKHLQVLADAGLVAGQRAGRELRWSLTPAALGPPMAWMSGVGGGFDDRVADLQRHLDDRRRQRQLGAGAGGAVRIAASRRPPPARS